MKAWTRIAFVDEDTVKSLVLEVLSTAGCRGASAAGDVTETSAG